MRTKPLTRKYGITRFQVERCSHISKHKAYQLPTSRKMYGWSLSRRHVLALSALSAPARAIEEHSDYYHAIHRHLPFVRLRCPQHQRLYPYGAPSSRGGLPSPWRSTGSTAPHPPARTSGMVHNLVHATPTNKPRRDTKMIIKQNTPACRRYRAVVQHSKAGRIDK